MSFDLSPLLTAKRTASMTEKRDALAAFVGQVLQGRDDRFSATRVYTFSIGGLYALSRKERWEITARSPRQDEVAFVVISYAGTAEAPEGLTLDLGGEHTAHRFGVFLAAGVPDAVRERVTVFRTASEHWDALLESDDVAAPGLLCALRTLRTITAGPAAYPAQVLLEEPVDSGLVLVDAGVRDYEHQCSFFVTLR